MKLNPDVFIEAINYLPLLSIDNTHNHNGCCRAVIRAYEEIYPKAGTLWDYKYLLTDYFMPNHKSHLSYWFGSTYRKKNLDWRATVLLLCAELCKDYNRRNK